jgi:hypothetical protein
MAGSDWDQENPYASPRSIDESPAYERPAEDLDDFVIEPSRDTRDWIDNLSLLLVSFEGSLVLWLVFVGICAAAWWWLGRVVAVVVGVGIGVVLLLPAGIYELLHRVEHLRVDAAGITVERRLGKSTLLAWKEVRRIRQATRAEVLRYVCLWLWLGTTGSLSTAGHYRIEWTGGYLYFPPKDPALFEEAIRKFGRQLLVKE